MLIGCLTFWPPNRDLSTYPIIGGIHPHDLFFHRDNSAAGKLTMSVCVCMYGCVCVLRFVENEIETEQKWLSKRVSGHIILSFTHCVSLPLSLFSAFSSWHFAAEGKQQIYCYVFICARMWPPWATFLSYFSPYQFHTERQQEDIRTSINSLSTLVVFSWYGEIVAKLHSISARRQFNQRSLPQPKAPGWVELILSAGGAAKSSKLLISTVVITVVTAICEELVLWDRS